MYINEKAWESQQEDPYIIRDAMENFLNVYKTLAQKYRIVSLYVSSEVEPYLRSETYPIAKWLYDADEELRRLYLTFWNKRNVYDVEDEYEVSYEGENWKSATEAYINNSFIISIAFDENWKEKEIGASLYSLNNDEENQVIIPNLYKEQQITESPFHEMLQEMSKIGIISYAELWNKREEMFPHLEFCPSVEDDFEKIDMSWCRQIVKKLYELDKYVEEYGMERFQSEKLSKTTPESDSTLRQYEAEHTFCDSHNKKYIASWHMRFTGIGGRIFFVPNYQADKILICYIGKKLPNTTYPT